MGMSVTVVADYLMNNCVDLYDEIYNRGFADGTNIDKTDEVKDFTDKFKKILSQEYGCTNCEYEGVYERCKGTGCSAKEGLEDIFYLIDETLNELKGGGKNE